MVTVFFLPGMRLVERVAMLSSLALIERLGLQAKRFQILAK
jgi:hypothetical protein